ncbi:MAG: ribonuclease [Eubacterium sp.]|nr:ribonuclease [Eubacterium sp.]
MLAAAGCGKSKVDNSAPDTAASSSGLTITDKTDHSSAASEEDPSDKDSSGSKANQSGSSAAQSEIAAEPENSSAAISDAGQNTSSDTKTIPEADISADDGVSASSPDDLAEETLDENGSYTSKDEVALYLHLYGHLPDNYITKKQAEKLGWISSKGNLQQVAPGKSIGGSRFGNYEGLLPDKKGRSYFECDIDYEGGRRNAKRIVYSDDGLIFYTEDHYNSFEQLY